MNGESRRRRVLVLAPFPPRLDGMHGGSRVIAQMIMGLAGRHEVGVLHLQDRDDGDVEEPLRRACSFFEAIPRPSKSRGLARQARIGIWLALGRPVWVAEWWAPPFATRLRAVYSEWQPDLVQIEFHVMAQYLSALGNRHVPRVVTEHEAGVLAAADERRFRRGAASVALGLDQRAWERYERRVLGRVDGVAVFSERDRQALSALTEARRLHRIPLGVPVPRRPLTASTQEPSVLFVGSFRHRPNIDAAVRLARDIHPRVRAHCPGARLYVVGEGPPDRLAALAGDGVVITGRVPDVTPYLERDAVVAAPIRFGGGVRVKVLEALAAGKAVVASRLAAAEVAGPHLVLAETDEQFASQIVQLLVDPERRSALGQAGRQWVQENATAELMVDALDAIHDSLLARPVLSGA